MVSLGCPRTEIRTDKQSATFKSIRSLQPLLDRVLVQRFKAETVSIDAENVNVNTGASRRRRVRRARDAEMWNVLETVWSRAGRRGRRTATRGTASADPLRREEKSRSLWERHIARSTSSTVEAQPALYAQIP